MSTQAEQIKERLGIVDVIGSYLKLERAGSSFKAKCPFHNEKTPSFYVSPARNSFYCFGCNKGGDIFTFVQEFEGLDFVGALRVLAARAGVELQRVDPTVQSAFVRLYLCLEKAARFFEAELEKATDAREYLSGRGLTRESARQWRLGFAPNEWRRLLGHLLQEGCSLEEMEKAGLVKRALQKGAGAGSAAPSPAGGEARFYDAFRGRVIFPIRDGAGRVIGFSGRILPALDTGETGKYINSPETPLFNKSEVLYGFDRAKLAIRGKDAAILVEGQMDLLMAHQAGFENAVAVSGTALSERHLDRLKRLSDNLLLAFDADEAGQKAAERAIRLALPRGFNVRVIALAGGKDPAELIAADAKKWEKSVSEAKHIIDFLADALVSAVAPSRERSLAVERRILPLIALLPSSVEQSHFIQSVSERVGLREEMLWKAFQRIPRFPSAPREYASSPPRPSAPAGAVRKGLATLAFLHSRPEWREDAESFARKIAERAGLSVSEEQMRSGDQDALFHEAEAFYGGEKPAPRELDELLQNVEEEYLSEALGEKIAALGEKEKSRNTAEISLLLGECKILSDRLAAVKERRYRK